MAINLKSLSAEAERLTKLCHEEGNWGCPRPSFEQTCPNVYCDDVEPEHWLEILKKETENGDRPYRTEKDGDMTFFEQVEVTAKLSKVSCKRPLNSTEKIAFGLIFTLCEEGKKLENANRDLWERVQELEKAMTKLVKIEVPLPECAVCWERDKCTDRAHGDNCLAIGFIIDTAMEAAKETRND